uniref:ADP-ribosylhydrolase ARH3 n=1 Tax=Phallusia mammillata TaxID=59560 RepID=A0A6F9D5S4_9ASCI|nr:poly(ADP-ribose) glycohydrolase ARH3-like [Phallusia mammillata]
MEKLKELAACSARLTHSHQDAVNGAILQAAAVYFALESNSATTWQEIWGKLKNVCKEIEPETSNREKPYTDRLTRMYLFLTSTGSISNNEVVSKIGVDIQATEAISAAIFAFLCCLANRQPEEIGSRDLLQRTVFYAISLGGDTDTIGTMAGAIAGAFCGVESVPQHWLVACEGWKKAEELADGMHRLFVKKSKK